MSEWLTQLLGNDILAIIKAVLLLICAFVCAWIGKTLLVKLLTKTKLKGWLGKGKEESYNKASEFVGKLAYFVIFMLFVPAIFECLGMTEVSEPVLSMLTAVWGFVPRLLGAVIILWVGVFIARFVRDLLVPVFAKIKVNKLQEKAGIEVEENGKLSNTLAYIVYIFILIPIIITALNALGIESISGPATSMLESLFGYVPNILAMLIIILLGIVLAKFAGSLVQKLIATSGLDAKLQKQLDTKEKGFVLSKTVGIIVNVVLVLFFVVESFSVLKLDVLTDIGSAVISYLPYVLAAVAILFLCYIADSVVQKALSKNGHTGAAFGCRIAIYAIGIFMVLSELSIAKNIVDTTFLVLIGGIAVAFAVSFGVGGREFAAGCLKKLESKLSGKKEE